MIMDKKGKLFGKLSIVDIVIVLALIAIVAVAGYKFIRPDTASPFTTKTDEIRLQFYAEEVPEYAAKAIKVGDPAKESLQNAGFGHVSDIKTDKSISWVDTDKGEYIAGTKKGYSSVVITLDGTGILSGNGVKIGNGQYYIGQTIVLYVGNSSLQGRISKIEKNG